MIVHPRLTEKCPINLLPHQVDHTLSIWKSLTQDQLFSYLDVSSTGSGKTISTLYLAWHLQKLYGTQVVIVAPSDTSLNNDDGWKAHAESFDIKIHTATTYKGLISKKNTWLKTTGKKKWATTPVFEDICKQGVCLIFDEFHNTKNPSLTHFASAALVKTAKEYRRVCRTVLLSHTPGDKIDVMPQLLRMTGIITEVRLFRHIPFTGEYEWTRYGLGELSNVCKKVGGNDVVSQKLNDAMFRFSAKQVNGICKELYDQYIRDKITFAMPKVENKYRAEMLNAFLETDPKSLKILNDGIDLLMGAVGWNPATQQVAAGGLWQLGNVGRSLKMIERGKLASMARYVMTEAKKSPNKKFVICCGNQDIKHHDLLAKMIYKEYTPDDHWDILKELKQKNENWRKLPKDMMTYIASFLEYKVPVDIINGKTKKEERVNILRKFQEDSNNSWCLLISPGVGSEAISLHDKHGNRPRDMLITPGFHFSRLIQSSGRVNRAGMQSDAKVKIVYSKNAALETKILNSMIKKSKTARDLMAKEQKVVFPGEFPYYIEGKKDRNLEEQLNQLKIQ